MDQWHWFASDPTRARDPANTGAVCECQLKFACRPRVLESKGRMVKLVKDSTLMLTIVPRSRHLSTRRSEKIAYTEDCKKPRASQP